MPKITFEDHEYLTEDNESVLDCLIRHDVSVHFSCKAGVCQSCMMTMQEGTPTEASQKGLKDAQKLQNYFLMCSLIPETDITIARPGEEFMNVDTRVLALDRLNDNVLRVRLARPEGYDYFPGQFLNLENPDGVERSYSLASLPDDEDFLELHISHVEGGKVSGWVHNVLKVGDSVSISPAAGDCFYTAGQPEQNLLLVGTGTGLAPLYGILRDALRQGHKGEIHLYHGSSRNDGLYLMEELRAIAKQHDNAHYHPCVSRGTAADGISNARADAQALEDHPKLNGWRIYLCGREDMVQSIRKKAFLAGASMKDIYADPFVPAAN